MPEPDEWAQVMSVVNEGRGLPQPTDIDVMMVRMMAKAVRDSFHAGDPLENPDAPAFTAALYWRKHAEASLELANKVLQVVGE